MSIARPSLEEKLPPELVDRCLEFLTGLSVEVGATVLVLCTDGRGVRTRGGRIMTPRSPSDLQWREWFLGG
jgi:hypothetical protein